jgi:hypothetical protein
MPSTAATLLNDVLRYILSYIADIQWTSTLYECTLVSKHWNDEANPLLWKHVELKSDDDIKRFLT